MQERPGAKELLDEAIALYDKRFWNEEEGLSCDTWNTEFTVLDDYRGLNANMHTVEAFLAASDVTGDEKYPRESGTHHRPRKGLGCKQQLADPGALYERLWVADLSDCNKEKPDDPFKPYGATPGHGIEWAGLITQWALSTYKEETEKKQHRILKQQKIFIAAQLQTHGMQTEHLVSVIRQTGTASRLYMTECTGPLAEAINTSSVLYRVTGKKKYADDYEAFMEYLDEKVLDHVNGSWFHQLDRNNNLMGTVWPGKSDLYHATQATLIPYYTADTVDCTGGKGRKNGVGKTV